MLVLSRRVGQDIYIGDDIIVTVISVVRGKVKLGVEAPRNIDVDRPEVRKRKRQAAMPAEETPIGERVFVDEAGE